MNGEGEIHVLPQIPLLPAFYSGLDTNSGDQLNPALVPFCAFHWIGTKQEAYISPFSASSVYK